MEKEGSPSIPAHVRVQKRGARHYANVDLARVSPSDYVERT